MSRFLKEYQITLETIGPVFVGSGKEIAKKEYMFLNNRQIGIADIQGLYMELEKRGFAQEFEKYMLGQNREDLGEWLKKRKISIEDVKKYIKYSMNCEDAIIEKGSRLQIMECMKDSYGKPYIPGTTLKGMIRTILLGQDIIQNPKKYQWQKQNIKRAICENYGARVNRNSFLKTNQNKIESIAFRTMNRSKDIKEDNALNDVLQGMVMSDSTPLSTEDLVLCQKFEVHTDGTEKTLPMLLECIKPHTKISFTITIDTKICSVKEKDLLKAIDIFMNSYYNNFVKAFSGTDRPQESCVLLGGVCGFVSKTVVYPMYGKKEGIDVTKGIFEKTKVPRNHKHEKDSLYGASPHILKCTRYQGRRLQFGLCKISILPR